MKALILNCSLKTTSSGVPSNTEALLKKVIAEYHLLNVDTEIVRVADYTLLPGTTSNEGEGDQWPEILEKIKTADIFIIATSIWLGRQSSIAQQVIERLDAVFHEDELVDSETGQYYTYNKVGGVVVTGNEDGAKASGFHILSCLTDFGFTIPPNALAYWLGSAGPGPSYIEAHGEKHEPTNIMYKYLVHNTVEMANILEKAPLTTSLKDLQKAAKEESR